MEALFLKHEGYFGALGTFLQSAFGEDVDKILTLAQSQEGQEQEGTALRFVSKKLKTSSLDINGKVLFTHTMIELLLVHALNLRSLLISHRSPPL